MKKCINPQAISIQRRFFEALELAISLGAINGVKGFCDAHNLNRTKYSRLKNDINKPAEDTTYKLIDIDALAGICADFGVSPEWLLLGRGKMLKTDNKCTSKKE